MVACGLWVSAVFVTAVAIALDDPVGAAQVRSK